MNKKNLSVVMAGAMLATSVAPVLADTTTVKKYEIGVDQQGILKSGLRNFIESKKFVSTDTNSDLAGKSVYAISTTNSTPADTTAGDLSSLTGSLTAGTKVYVWDLGYREVNGKYYSTSDGNVTTESSTFTASDLKDAETKLNKNFSSSGEYDEILKEKAVYDNDTKTLTITLLSANVSDGSNIQLTFKEGDAKVDFDTVITKDGVKYAKEKVKKSGATASSGEVNVADVVGFAPAGTTIADGADIPAKKIAEITITANTENSLLVSDLYDGTMLTDKGYEILKELKDATVTKSGVFGSNGTDELTTDGTTTAASTAVTADSTTGIVTFYLKYSDEYGNKHEYTVRGTDEAEAQKVAAWLATRNPSVDVLAGNTRYETAVEIAKEAFGNDFELDTSSNTDVVLVNGTALVDGLAAAPYAKVLGDDGAPILLSETDSLPTATKDYLKKITENVAPADMDEITIHLVGGEAVLSDSVKKELKDMGFTVKRISGDDREETSIAVAKAARALGVTVADNKAFLVGATGEADAMSIAAVASDKSVNGTSTKVVPIIVSGVHGLSEDAMDYLSTSDTTVIGGTVQISNEEYKALNEANGDTHTVTRIAGANRQATNAAIIKEYYSKNTAINTKSVVIAKDGMNNKTELVDALGASTLASKLGAPIVLGTNKLSDAQVNEIELADSTNASAIYQVGHGVSKDIVKTLVKKFGL